MKKKAYVSIKRVIPTYTRLRGISCRSLKEAEQNEDARISNCTISMLFSALCLEAFLNHLGSDIFKFWEKMYRRLSPDNKLLLIAREQSLEIDFSVRPFQTFKDIFKFRNWLVHASTEELTFEGEILLEEGEQPPKPLSKWEKLIGLKIAQRYSEDTKSIIAAFQGFIDISGEPAFISEIVETNAQFTADSDNIL